MAYLIELGCPPDGVVLDPFVGSGTTCIAAQRLQCKWIGIEINGEYAEIARARLRIEKVIQIKRPVRECRPSERIKKEFYEQGSCSYKGKCSFRTANGMCGFKRYCKERIK